MIPEPPLFGAACCRRSNAAGQRPAAAIVMGYARGAAAGPADIGVRFACNNFSPVFPPPQEFRLAPASLQPDMVPSSIAAPLPCQGGWTSYDDISSSGAFCIL
jgi:hypothetical protein